LLQAFDRSAGGHCDMTNYLITGASRGIGRELTARLCARGDSVIAVCRSKTPELSRLGAEVIDGIELKDAKAIARVASALQGRTIDVLVNNAGISRSAEWQAEDPDNWRELFEVNAVATVLFTRALLPALRTGSRIVMVSSRLGSIAGATAAMPDLGYRMSKASLNMAGKLMAETLRPEGIAVLMLHPGYVRTDMNEGRGDISVEESATGLIALIDRLGIAETGTYWHVNGQPLPW
jgi:NAD(P)-dependent dehydrogenase (short-subunit alcohol dehydrogenase family)